MKATRRLSTPRPRVDAAATRRARRSMVSRRAFWRRSSALDGRGAAAGVVGVVGMGGGGGASANASADASAGASAGASASVAAAAAGSAATHAATSPPASTAAKHSPQPAPVEVYETKTVFCSVRPLEGTPDQWARFSSAARTLVLCGLRRAGGAIDRIAAWEALQRAVGREAHDAGGGHGARPLLFAPPSTACKLSLRAVGDRDNGKNEGRRRTNLACWT